MKLKLDDASLICFLRAMMSMVKLEHVKKVIKLR